MDNTLVLLVLVDNVTRTAMVGEGATGLTRPVSLICVRVGYGSLLFYRDQPRRVSVEAQVGVSRNPSQTSAEVHQSQHRISNAVASSGQDATVLVNRQAITSIEQVGTCSGNSCPDQKRGEVKEEALGALHLCVTAVCCALRECRNLRE